MLLEKELTSNMIPKTTSKYPTPGSRYIYNALYDTLVCLKPKACLEIGTFHGQSARVFQDYFTEHCPEGILITIDIKHYVYLTDCPNVFQVIGHPHVANSTQWHHVDDKELLEYTDSSVRANVKKINEANHGKKFDFCFLDGDHQLESVRRDFLIAANVLEPPKYILFDDIDVEQHDSARYYREQILTKEILNVYDYANWGVWVGAALIWQKEMK